MSPRGGRYLEKPKCSINKETYVGSVLRILSPEIALAYKAQLSRALSPQLWVSTLCEMSWKGERREVFSPCPRKLPTHLERDGGVQRAEAMSVRGAGRRHGARESGRSRLPGFLSRGRAGGRAAESEGTPLFGLCQPAVSPPALSPEVIPPCSPCVLRHREVALLWVPWSLAYSVVCPKATGNRKAGVFGLAGSHWDLRFAFKLT